MKKTFTFCILLSALCVFLAACGKKCEQHVYDDCADVECNVCGDKRDSMHTWDVANCTSERKCTVCGAIAVEIKDAHNDADHDYTCDNEGCRVTVGTPPKDENPGIDLPIDTN